MQKRYLSRRDGKFLNKNCKRHGHRGLESSRRRVFGGLSTVPTERAARSEDRAPQASSQRPATSPALSANDDLTPGSLARPQDRSGHTTSLRFHASSSCFQQIVSEGEKTRRHFDVVAQRMRAERSHFPASKTSTEIRHLPRLTESRQCDSSHHPNSLDSRHSGAHRRSTC
jgi:hypothetical protein